MYGQTWPHLPQPVQASSSTTAVVRSRRIFPCLRSIAAFEAAPLAWETVSMMSFGPWAVPPMKTPSVKVSRGFIFGWASWKKPSGLLVRLRTDCSSAMSPRGTIPSTSTTRSARISTSTLRSRSFTVTVSRPPLAFLTLGGSPGLYLMKLTPSPLLLL